VDGPLEKTFLVSVGPIWSRLLACGRVAKPSIAIP